MYLRWKVSQTLACPTAKDTMCFQSETDRRPFMRRNINQTICIDPEMLTLAQLLERDVLRGSSNVDFAERRGVGNQSHNLHLS